MCGGIVNKQPHNNDLLKKLLIRNLKIQNLLVVNFRPLLPTVSDCLWGSFENKWRNVAGEQDERMKFTLCEEGRFFPNRSTKHFIIVNYCYSATKNKKRLAGYKFSIKRNNALYQCLLRLSVFSLKLFYVRPFHFHRTLFLKGSLKN